MVARRAVVGGVLVECGKNEKFKVQNPQIVLLIRIRNNTKCGCRGILKFAQTQGRQRCGYWGSGAHKRVALGNATRLPIFLSAST